MPVLTYSDLVVLFAAGVGLVALGLVHLFLVRASRLARLGAGFAVAGLTAAAPIALAHPSAAGTPAVIVAGAALAVAIAGSGRFTALVQAACRAFQRPSVRAASLLILGAGVAVGAAVQVEAEDEALAERDTAWMMALDGAPVLRPANGTYAITDCGWTVELAEPEAPRPADARLECDRRLLADLGFAERVIRVGPPTDDSNCHGWVFTGGKYWVSEAEVENILSDNGYQPVSEPAAGDLAVYRTPAGQISHTAVVRAAGDGKPVLLEGKWGALGVFLHSVDACAYGKNVTYYRSPRAGHLLAGLGGPESQHLYLTTE
jgi:hypothetical protein